MRNSIVTFIYGEHGYPADLNLIDPRNNTATYPAGFWSIHVQRPRWMEGGEHYFFLNQCGGGSRGGPCFPGQVIELPDPAPAELTAYHTFLSFLSAEQREGWNVRGSFQVQTDSGTVTLIRSIYQGCVRRVTGGLVPYCVYVRDPRRGGHGNSLPLYDHYLAQLLYLREGGARFRGVTGVAGGQDAVPARALPVDQQGVGHR